MKVHTLQSFVDGGHIEGVSESVDLLHIARNFQGPRPKQNKIPKPPKRLSLVLDAECCLDRLYGGFFSDWICGGQWNRMLQFLHQLISCCQKGNIDLTVAFNGAFEQQRLTEWVQLQERNRQNINSVFRHIQNKGTPPPKVWWVPPVCLTTALRLALRYYNVPVICSMDDHHQEVLAYCRENSLAAIMGDDTEYLVFDPPLCFSASHIKLTFKGNIETREYSVEKLAEGLGVNHLGICIMTVLLGNFNITEAQLADFYARIKINPTKEPVDAVTALAEYVKELENVDNLESLAAEIFGSEKTDKVIKCRQAFVESIQYYLNGTKDGFLKYKPRKGLRKRASSTPARDIERAEGGSTSAEDSEALDTSRFASETVEIEAGSRKAYKQLAEPARATSQFLLDEKEEMVRTVRNEVQVNGSLEPINGNASTSSITAQLGDLSMDVSKRGDEKGEKSDGKKKAPKLPPEVLRTACERHQRGLMSHYIYQILTQGEIKLPVVMEDEHHRELPSVHSIYRPVRQSVYAILFNVHHQLYLVNKEIPPGEEKPVFELPTVQEWNYPYTEPETVKAEPISWPVPTIQRLWFGTNMEDMRRRLRAFLTCMKSENPRMLTAAYVPQHLLVMASVLRYLMQVKPPVLRQLELDAFIVTAFTPDLVNSDLIQDLQLTVVTPRGVQLATMFMQGVEMALLANDACGAPIPYLMCSPWLYFDGKLFHSILSKAEHVKSLQELCCHRVDVQVKVERMRHAILENLNVQYARRAMPPTARFGGFNPVPTHIGPPPGYNPGIDRRNFTPRGAARRLASSRGGQLAIAGVVVGNWAPNHAFSPNRVAAVNNERGFGRGFPDRASYPTRGGMYKRRPSNARRPKPRKQGEKKKDASRESMGRGITDDNSAVNASREEGFLVSSDEDGSSGGTPEQFEDATHEN